jgi:hypothetical protein
VDKSNSPDILTVHFDVTRRQFSCFINNHERRSGEDRRSGNDRRNGNGIRTKQGRRRGSGQ